MPPALRNQRAPTAGDTPAPTAASSLEHPVAITAQNRWQSPRRATEGRPGEGNPARPDRSERRFRTVIATSSLKVLRRPLECELHPTVAVMNEPAWRTVALESHDQSINAQPRLEVIRHGPAHDLARGQVLESGQVEKPLVGGDVRKILSA